MQPDTVGARIRAARRGRRLSQREVARRLGRPNSLVSFWEAGLREPTVVDLVALARVLRRPVDDLLAGRGTGARRASSRAHGFALRRRVGDQFRRRRARLGLTPHDVYVTTGVTSRRLLMIEEGRDASVAELGALRSIVGEYESLVAAARAEGPAGQAPGPRRVPAAIGPRP